MVERPLQEVIKSIDQISIRLSEMEKDALAAVSQRGITISTTIAKMGVGAAFFFDMIKGGSTTIDFAIGIGLIAWGIKDAAEIPERFRRAKVLVEDSRFLRQSLTRSYHEVINGIPYRALEDKEPIL